MVLMTDHFFDVIVHVAVLVVVTVLQAGAVLVTVATLVEHGEVTVCCVVAVSVGVVVDVCTVTATGVTVKVLVGVVAVTVCCVCVIWKLKYSPGAPTATSRNRKKLAPSAADPRGMLVQLAR